jgi:hypothetical protein
MLFAPQSYQIMGLTAQHNQILGLIKQMPWYLIAGPGVFAPICRTPEMALVVY